jgi:hypothetical protein
MQDAIRIDVEADIDLRRATRSRRDAFEIEFAQALVCSRHFPFALVDLDRHGRLVVVGGRKYLAELGRNRRVFLDHLGHDAAHGLDAERQWRHVQQQQVLSLA